MPINTVNSYPLVATVNISHINPPARGISMVPTMFGAAFSSEFMNQAGALVHVYEDGSVLLSHGGTEMGQGLHTKMIQ
ncbi:hypothetical protein PR048_010273, partial [Dryococelus australis]